MNFKIKICLLLTAFLILSNNKSFAQIFRNAPAAIHIQSDVSDGKYSFQEIVKTAKEKDIKVLIFTDTAMRRWEFGIRPLEAVIMRRINQDSVFSFGIRNYLRALEDIQRDNPDMVIVPAVEVVPFYYWTGNFYDGSLTLYNWHKQVLIMGLEKESDYRYLPIIANYSWVPLNKKDLRRLWPLLLIILGIFALRRHPRRTSYRQWGYALLVLGVLFLINNSHFSISNFDAYHGDQQTRPYQELIDYVNKKGGYIFWAHPEAKNIDRVIDVNVVTYPYKDDLLYAYGYTGSAMLFDESRSVAQVGGIWDKVLLDYCLGRREKPIWAIGEIDYHGEGKDLAGVQTVFLLEDFTKDGVIKALASGKMYTKLNNQTNDFSLEAFVISDEKKETFGFMGDEIELSSKPGITIRTSCSTYPGEPLEIRLIRNGEVINEFTSENSNSRIKFQDEYFKPGEKIYYRIMLISGKNSYRVISNPIFVKFVRQ
ncbi:MAG: hypothetical protein ABH954_03300 [Candidatus Omnitrophota bacterium]